MKTKLKWVLYIILEEGTTQGDNCASAFYSCSPMPLLDILPTEPPDIPPKTPKDMRDTDPEKPPEKPPKTPPKKPPDITSKTTPEAEKPPDNTAKHICFADDSGAAGMP